MAQPFDKVCVLVPICITHQKIVILRSYSQLRFQFCIIIDQNFIYQGMKKKTRGIHSVAMFRFFV